MDGREVCRCGHQYSEHTKPVDSNLPFPIEGCSKCRCDGFMWLQKAPLAPNAWFAVIVPGMSDRAYSQFRQHQTNDNGERWAFRCPCVSCYQVRIRIRDAAENMNLLPREGD